MICENDRIKSIERYGDRNEVNYDLIFEEMILKRKVRDVISKHTVLEENGEAYIEDVEKLVKELGL